MNGESVWAHRPKCEDVLHCLILDAQCGSGSFDDFCNELGYSNDSLSALDIYRDCMKNGEKLRNALAENYSNVVEYIESLEL